MTNPESTLVLERSHNAGRSDYKNANIFTADSEHPKASAIAVKDGKFVYVGDEAGLSENMRGLSLTSLGDSLCLASSTAMSM